MGRKSHLQNNVFHVRPLLKNHQWQSIWKGKYVQSVHRAVCAVRMPVLPSHPPPLQGRGGLDGLSNFTNSTNLHSYLCLGFSLQMGLEVGLPVLIPLLSLKADTKYFTAHLVNREFPDDASVGLDTEFSHTPLPLSRTCVCIGSKQHRYRNQPGHLGSHSRLLLGLALPAVSPCLFYIHILLEITDEKNNPQR